jgi:hypothetical protein
MIILLFSLKPDKICIYNLSGKPEIWISHELMAKDNDAVLDCLRKKLNDNTITKLMMDKYMIIRHPDRMKYIELGQIPDINDLILFDDLFFVLELMKKLDNSRDIIYLYSQLSDRLRLDRRILYHYLGIDSDCEVDLDHDLWFEFGYRVETLPGNITKELIIDLIQYGNNYTRLLSRDDMYSYLSEPMRYDIDIIKCVLSNSCTKSIDKHHSDRFYKFAPSYIFDYDFIIANFDNECVITIYLWMDYKYDRIHNMDACKRLVLLKMAIKHTMELYKFRVRDRIISNMFNVTKKYISLCISREESKLHQEEMINIFS